MARPEGDGAHAAGSRAKTSGAGLTPAAAEAHLRDLAAVIPGAFYRFRSTPDGQYLLDFVTEGGGGLTDLARMIDLADFDQWVAHMPAGHVEAFLASIDRSKREMTTWIHEWPMETAHGRIWLQGISQPHAEPDGGIVWNGLVLDVTAGREAAAERDRVETDYKSIFENTTEGIVQTSREGRVLDANWPLVRMHGFTSKQGFLEAVNDLSIDWYVHAEDRARFLAAVDLDGYVEGFEAEIYRIGTGERIWVQVNSRAIHDDNGNLLYYQGTIRDITAEYRARRLRERRGELLELIARGEPLTMILYEIVGTIEAYRTTVTAAIMGLNDGVLEVEAAPGLANACIDALQSAAPSRVGGAVAAAMQHDGICLQSRSATPSPGEEPLASAMRQAGHGEAVVAPVRDHHGTVLGFLAAFATSPDEVDQDLRGLLHEMAQIIAIALEQHRLAQRLVEQAQYDALTGLPNRALLSDRMQQLMLEAGRSEHTVAVLLLDLDEFKLVNDTLGHDAGDLLLREVGQRLKACVRAADTLARFGGDEFVIALPLGSAERTRELIDRILAALAAPVMIKHTEVVVRASIGISLFPQDGLTVDNLVQAADTAMYAAKRAGRNQYHFFDESMNQAMKSRLRVEADLHAALASDQLAMYYQPRLQLADGRPTGAEALVRWHHPQRGLLLPGEFIEIAEQSTLIDDIDGHVLRSVIRQAGVWQAAGYRLQISLNLSSRALQQPDFGRDVAGLLNEYGVDPAGIEIEVTESMIMQDFRLAAGHLRDLRERAPGIRVAVDDFGTGYSSLKYLAQLPLDILKIDRSFVAELLRPEAATTARTLAGTIITLGDQLGLDVIAEGIECRAQAELLLELGCREGQGFWYAHPLPVDGFETWLASRAQ